MTRNAFQGFFIFSVCIAMICLALGTWQLQRHYWKADLIAEADANAKGPAIAIPLGSNPAIPAYTRLTVEGRFLPDKDIIIRGYAIKGVSGSRLFAPFELEDGRIIVVQRGWAPRGKEADSSVKNTNMQQIEIVWRPVKRRSSDKGLLRPVNLPEEGIWTYVDPSAMLLAWSLGDSFSSGYGELRSPNSSAENLVIEEFKSDLFNRHLEYVATWWSLGAAMLGIFGLIWRDQRRKKG